MLQQKNVDFILFLASLILFPLGASALQIDCTPLLPGEAYNLSGIVMDEMGRVIPGAYIYAFRTDNFWPELITTSDQEGRFSRTLEIIDVRVYVWKELYGGSKEKRISCKEETTENVFLLNSNYTAPDRHSVTLTISPTPSFNFVGCDNLLMGSVGVLMTTFNCNFSIAGHDYVFENPACNIKYADNQQVYGRVQLTRDKLSDGVVSIPVQFNSVGDFYITFYLECIKYSPAIDKFISKTFFSIKDPLAYNQIIEQIEERNITQEALRLTIKNTEINQEVLQLNNETLRIMREDASNNLRTSWASLIAAIVAIFTLIATNLKAISGFRKSIWNKFRNLPSKRGKNKIKLS